MFDNGFKPSLEEIAAALGGDILGDNVLAPGPGHSPEDRSLTVTLADNDEGFICHSFADDDWRVCKDYIKEQLKQPERPVYQKAQSKPRGSTVEYYIYPNKDGENHLRVERTDTHNFFQCHWTGAAWVNGAPSERLPYRLPELLAADVALPVVLVEGEKDANNAAALGLIATTTPGGGNSKWTPDIAEWFRGRNVFIIPDNDNVGYKYLDNAAKHLQAVAAAVHVLELPGLGPRLEKHGKDLSDWLGIEGNTSDKLRALIEAAPLWEPFKDAAAYAEEIERLAHLSAVEYDRARGPASKSIGCRAETLDNEVKKKRRALGLDKDEEDTKGQGRPIEFPEIETWAHPVDGAAMLRDMSNQFKRYLIAPEGATEIMALWATHTHKFECFYHTPRLAITSPVKRCGKSRVIELLATVCARALTSEGITVAAIRSTVELKKPTALLDEGDTFLVENEEMRGFLNSGHKRGGAMIKTVGDDHEPRMFSTWAPAAVAMIGKQMWDTLDDRSIKIRMRRRKKGEKVEGFRGDHVDQLKELQRKAVRWTNDHEAELATAEPNMGGLFDRVADNWRPLFAIADTAGGEWPELVRKIAKEAEEVQEDQAIAIKLLEDIRDILASRPDDRIKSTDLANCLGEMDDRPWSDWRGGKAITAAAVAKLLDDFEIKPSSHRFKNDTKTSKGYLFSDFSDAFDTYLYEAKDRLPPPGAVSGFQAGTEEDNNNNGLGEKLANANNGSRNTPEHAGTGTDSTGALSDVPARSFMFRQDFSPQNAENTNNINDVTAVPAKNAKTPRRAERASNSHAKNAELTAPLCSRCGGEAETGNPIMASWGRHPAPGLRRGSGSMSYLAARIAALGATIVATAPWAPVRELPDLRHVEILALDTETCDRGIQASIGPAWPWRDGHICGVSVAYREEGEICGHYFPIRHPDSANFDPERVFNWVRDHVASDVRILTQNGLYDWGWLHADAGIQMPASDRLEEIGALATIVDENRRGYQPYSLDALCEWRGIPGKDEGLLKAGAEALGLLKGRKKPKLQELIHKLPAHCVGPYAEADAAATLALFKNLYPTLAEEGTLNAYRLEVDLLPMVLEMRRRGIRIDQSAAEQLREAIVLKRDAALRELSEQLGSLVGMDEIKSKKWLVQTFDAHGVQYELTEKGNASFKGGKRGWMVSHEHFLPRLISAANKYNEAVTKFMDTYILGHLVNGRIHAGINPHRSEDGGTKTTRFSYSNPPLQQIPKHDQELGPEIRKCFLPEEGALWATLDASQQELRLIVHFAEKENLPRAKEAGDSYRDESKKADFHQVAADMAGISRNDAKTINFAKAYGSGTRALVARLNKPEDEALAILAQYDKELPFIRLLQERCEQAILKRGYLRLYDGARRHWPTDESGDPEKLYRAMNSLIQGSAARHTKLWMRARWQEGIVPLLQMHDALECSLSSYEQAERIQQLGREAVSLTVPMLIDAQFGHSWGDAKHTWEEIK